MTCTNMVRCLVPEDMKQTHQLLLHGRITPQGFGEFYKPPEERLNQLLAGLPKLEAGVVRLNVNHISAQEVVHELGRCMSNGRSSTTTANEPLLNRI
jgi:hypothetical protein